jgi:phage terminase large subunit
LEKKIILSPKYKPLFKLDTRYSVVTGGRGSGKSFGVTLLLLSLTFEKNQIILFSRYTMVSAKLSIIPQFIEVMELMGYDSNTFDVKQDEIINKKTGSKIIFKGIKTSSGVQTAALKSLTGVSCFVLDEAEELEDETIFDKIDLSVRVNTTQNRVILIMNPATKESWIYKRFFQLGQLDNTTYIHTDYRDNIKNLDESIISEIERMKDVNPTKYNHVILGGWLDKAEGTVFNNWEIGEYDDSLPKIYGLDFGYSNDPTALIQTSLQKDCLYLKELLYLKQLSAEQIAEAMRNIGIDNYDLIVCDSSEPRMIKFLKDKGFNVKPAKKGADSVRGGIKKLENYRMIITEDSKNLMIELNNYCWNDKKSGIPIDDYNHLCDAMRYAGEKLINPKGSIIW